MGILLPEQPLTDGERVLRELFTGTFVTYRNVYEDEVDLATVRGWVQAIPVETTLAVCSVLSRYASVHSRRDPSQPDLIRWALSPLHVPAVLDLLAGGDQAARQFLFHHEQLLLASKLALLYGSDVEADLNDVEQRHAVGRVLLAVNDLLLTVGKQEDPRSDAMLGLVVRSLAINNVEEPLYQIGRTNNMFVERAASTDIGESFLAEFGAEIPEFMAFAFYCAVPFDPFNIPLPPHLDPAGLFNAGRILAERVNANRQGSAMLPLLAADRAWFRRELNDGKVGGSTFYPFQSHPYYQSSTGAIFPLNYRFLLEKVGSGIFWMLHAAKRAKKGRHVETFMGVVGERITEPYGIDLLRSATPAATGQLFIAGPDIPRYRSPRRGEVRGSDAYLLDGSRLAVFEITASGIPIDTLLSGDGARFRTDFERKMVRDPSKGKLDRGKLGQLDRVIGDLLAGHLQLPGVDINHLTTIYPVLVSPQYIPLFATIRPVIDDLLRTHGMFAFTGTKVVVAPVRIVAFEELEILTGDLSTGKARLLATLQGWTDDPFDHDSSLKNHLLRHGYKESQNPQLSAAYNRWGEATTQALLKVGLAT
jgi:hypothetical protein